MTEKTHDEIYIPWTPLKEETLFGKEEALASAISDFLFYAQGFIPHHKDLHGVSIAFMDLDRLLLNCKVALDRVEQAQPQIFEEPHNSIEQRRQTDAINLDELFGEKENGCGNSING